jgi:hypothetical protein
VDTRAPAEQTSRNDAGVVQDQELIPTEELRELSERAVPPRTTSAIEREKEGRIPSIKRPLGNLFARQMVIELFETHCERV